MLLELLRRGVARLWRRLSISGTRPCTRMCGRVRTTVHGGVGGWYDERLGLDWGRCGRGNGRRLETTRHVSESLAQRTASKSLSLRLLHHAQRQSARGVGLRLMKLGRDLAVEEAQAESHRLRLRRSNTTVRATARRGAHSALQRALRPDAADLMSAMRLVLLPCGVMRMRGHRAAYCPLSCSETLVLAARQKGEADSTMIAAVLVVVAKTVHVLVPTRTLADTTSKRPQTTLSLALDVSQIGFADEGKVGVRQREDRRRGKRGRGCSLRMLSKLRRAVGQAVLSPITVW